MRVLIFLISFGMLLNAAGAWAADVRVTGQIVSEYAAGPPFQVNSLNKVLNLNADRVDGKSASDFAGVSELATAGSGIEVHWKNISNIPGVEIDQDCALSGGCDTGSDSSGFPVTITQPGSYRLASNLTTSDANTTLVSIDSSNVILDLQGFSLIGPVTCSGLPVSSCSHGLGTGEGIKVLPDANRSSITILNGSVEGMGERGIECSAPCKVHGVHVTQNRTIGVVTFSDAIVENVLAVRNGENGINVDGVVRDCVVRGNGKTGMHVDGSVSNCRAALNGEDGMSVTGSVMNSTASQNQLRGFRLNGASTGIGNNAVSNNGDGFSSQFLSTLKGNSASANGGDGFAGTGVWTGNAAFSNDQDGFACGDCLLINNIARGNKDQGVQFTGLDSAWGGNMLFGNANPVTGASVDLGNNACDGSTTC